MIDWVDLCVLSGIEGMLGESSLVKLACCEVSRGTE